MLRYLISKTDALRQNGIVEAIKGVLDDPALSILDVGCGHGLLAERLMADNPLWQIQGVDVVVQPECPIPVTRYDGEQFPFPDKSFDAVFCVDMLHHTDDPRCLLREACRVAKKWVIVKDHIADSRWDHGVLTFLDWTGNVGTGVPMPYNFLSSQQWKSLYDEVGLIEVEKRHPIRYWPGIIGHALDRQFHFTSKLKVS
ncbi:class I SAM-dependent methyltransferase [Terasakiella pusilla]|uniref:class I SAM-dependent methyltransferase n=1 Tax=Terasakiella pusilla TaxID=64973 RepID=UPI003AA8C8D8